MKCFICDKTIDPVKTSGAEIYPHRKDLHNLILWKCPFCSGYVGSHKNSGKPLGDIVSKDVKKARIEIHKIIDPIWKSKKYTREFLYKMISGYMGFQYHTARIRDLKEAQEVIEYVKTLQ